MWSCWSSWSKCSATCGGGHYMRTRSCTNPAPAYGGDICLGLHTEEALCNTQTCPGTQGLGYCITSVQTHLSELRTMTKIVSHSRHWQVSLTLLPLVYLTTLCATAKSFSYYALFSSQMGKFMHVIASILPTEEIYPKSSLTLLSNTDDCQVAPGFAGGERLGEVSRKRVTPVEPPPWCAGRLTWGLFHTFTAYPGTSTLCAWNKARKCSGGTGDIVGWHLTQGQGCSQRLWS